ncbi:hypothetical protein DUNSADRAFT_5040 [Dunaliella salina]|uniref:Uncharacterized protein n=1 Tax=Dunaliella salina TaxID=3046 RepID=A0ABQ7HAC3_DUNSA|nr:hypothetical protein DUNSADRAFT_5040 [Dunaliella salina]|eukprot:KAF5843803.1 hypothetical protein DUNSADRAFT_5040 [Dunaliella salina]
MPRCFSHCLRGRTCSPRLLNQQKCLSPSLATVVRPRGAAVRVLQHRQQQPLEGFPPAQTQMHHSACNGKHCVFAGHTAGELHEWLESHGVDTRSYGKDTSKTVAELLEEQAKNESLLNVVDGRAMRTVKVLSLHITNGNGQVRQGRDASQ